MEVLCLQIASVFGRTNKAIATILDDLTNRFRNPPQISTEYPALVIEDQVFKQSFDRWATRGQHTTSVSQTWNLNSTKSFLAHQLAAYRNVPISDVTRIVHRSISYWSQYPMLAKDRDNLDEDDLIRAVAFLIDCDRTIFQDVDTATQTVRIRWEENERDDEITFRSLAVLVPRARRLAGHNPDVLGVLYALKPLPDDEDDPQTAERILSVPHLKQVAERISAGKHPVHAYYIPRHEFVSLCAFYNALLEGFQPPTEGSRALATDLEKLKEYLGSISTSEVSWNDCRASKVAVFVGLLRCVYHNDANIQQKILRAAQTFLFSRLMLKNELGAAEIHYPSARSAKPRSPSPVHLQDEHTPSNV